MFVHNSENAPANGSQTGISDNYGIFESATAPLAFDNVARFRETCQHYGTVQ